MDTVPSVLLAVDCLIFGFDLREFDLKLLLIKRSTPPFKDAWALPGGFVREGEAIRQTAARKLVEETGISQMYFDELKAYTAPGRDPRGRVISMAFYALIPFQEKQEKRIEGKHESQWHSLSQIPALAFDHQQILQDALAQLKKNVLYAPILFHLLPKKFTLNELQRIYELITRVPQDTRNFRKKVTKLAYIEKLAEKETNVAHRPAALYAFNANTYQQVQNERIF